MLWLGVHIITNASATPRPVWDARSLVPAGINLRFCTDNLAPFGVQVVFEKFESSTSCVVSHLILLLRLTLGRTTRVVRFEGTRGAEVTNGVRNSGYEGTWHMRSKQVFPHAQV